MAPIVPSQEKTESFLLEGTGVFLLTEEQRRSRRLSVVAEKIALGGRVEYHNYSTPEPKCFWGYVQWVQRDFVVRTVPLEYRRQVLYSWDSYELEPVEQLRCLVKDSTLLLFDNIATILLAGGADAEQIGQDRANFVLRNGQPRLVPTIPETGLYHEVIADRGLKITLIWQDYLAPCENPAGSQYLQPPRAPERGESGDGAGGGGGTRPVEPPPEDRTEDQGSDNSAPPADGAGPPPLPTPEEPPPPPQRVRVTYILRTRPSDTPSSNILGYTPITSSLACVNEPSFGPNAKRTTLSIFGSTFEGGPSVLLGGDTSVSLGGECFEGQILSLTPEP